MWPPFSLGRSFLVENAAETSPSANASTVEPFLMTMSSPVSDEGDGLAAARACTDRHGRVIERNALVGIDTIFNTACVKGGVRDRETALSVDGKISPGVRP